MREEQETVHMNIHDWLKAFGLPEPESIPAEVADMDLTPTDGATIISDQDDAEALLRLLYEASLRRETSQGEQAGEEE